MEISQDFDFLISKYSDDLMRMKEKWSKWGIVTEEKKEEAKNEEAPEEAAISVAALTETVPKEITAEKQAEEREEKDEYSPTGEEESGDALPIEASNEPEAQPEPVKTPYSALPKAAPENYAYFTARVFTGEQAYPVESAKVLLYLDGNLHTFLITNASGETPRVKIESAPAENALIPNSNNQELDYSADVYAAGFQEKKGLLVSAVGDSDIILTVQLIPLPERID